MAELSGIATKRETINEALMVELVKWSCFDGWHEYNHEFTVKNELTGEERSYGYGYQFLKEAENKFALECRKNSVKIAKVNNYLQGQKDI